MKFYGKLKKYDKWTTYLGIISIISALIFDNIIVSKIAMLSLVLCLCLHYYLKRKMKEIFLQSRINSEPPSEISYDYIFRWAIIVWVVFIFAFMGMIGLYLENKIGLPCVQQLIEVLAIFFATYTAIVAFRYSKDSKRSPNSTQKPQGPAQLKENSIGPTLKSKNIEKGDE